MTGPTAAAAEVSAPVAGGTQAVDRAATLIDLIVGADEPLSYTELTRASGLARSTTSRLLSALERTELVERDELGMYVPGPLFSLFAARHDPWMELARLASPLLRTLRDDTGETVHLAIARGAGVDHIAQVDSVYLLGSSRDWTGVEVPPHSSALGKVLYAYGCLPYPDAHLEARTHATITTVDALRRERQEILRRGFATAVDELEVGLSAYAAPVHGRDGEVIAALGLSGPTPRLHDQVDHLGRLLITQSDRLSALLSRRSPKEGAA